MKIVLIGYGKTGQKIEEAALRFGHEVIGICGSRHRKSISAQVEKKIVERADMCIHFAHESTVVDDVKLVVECGKNLVIGTTGWDHKIDEVRNIILNSSVGLIYSPNFSWGVQAFFRMVAHAAQVCQHMLDYDVSVVEEHHRHKVDSPSGTAIQLGRLLQNVKEEVPIASVRCGSIPGNHRVMLDGVNDSIVLEHVSRNRDGFAQGAVKAGEWLQGKKGFFTFDDMYTMCGSSPLC